MTEDEKIVLEAIEELIKTDKRTIAKAPHRVRDIVHTLAAAVAVKNSILTSTAVPKKAPVVSKEK